MVAAVVAAPTVLRGDRAAVTHRHGTPAALLAALPEFLIGTVLLIVVAVWLRWAPPYGWQGWHFAVLPSLAMGIPAGAILGRLLDEALPGALAEPWVRTWNGAGFRRGVLGRAAVRRSLPALIPQVALVMVGLLGGAVTVEVLFAVPGLGRTAVGAASAQDVPVVQACVLVLLLLGVAAGGVAGLLQRVVLGPALSSAALPACPLVRMTPGRLGRWLPVLLAGALVILAVAGLLRDPTTVDVAMRLAPPSNEHPLGADALGRDVLGRLGNGAVRTVGYALLISAVAFFVGCGVGLSPGGGGGVIEVTNALPAVVVGLLTAATMGPGAAGALVAVGLVAWAPMAAHANALGREARASEHVAASRALGAGEWWLFRRHVLPAVTGPVLRHTLLRLPAVALALASLGFLGLGAQPPTPEWGLVLAEALPYVERAPWAAIVPAAALGALGALAVSLSTLPPPRRKVRPET